MSILSSIKAFISSASEAQADVRASGIGVFGLWAWGVTSDILHHNIHLRHIATSGSIIVGTVATAMTFKAVVTHIVKRKLP